MADILLVSKPIAPPWHDSSKNLVRDLAANMARHVPIVLSKPGAELALPRARIETIYRDAGGSFSPALRDNARVLGRLLFGPRAQLWHFFFAPNPRTSRVASLAARARRARTVQTVCSAPRDDVDVRSVLFAQRVVVLSEHTRARFLRAGVAAERLRLIRPGVAPLAPLTHDAAQRARERLSVACDRPLVLYAGDLEFGRGADLALQAHAALPRTLDALLVIASRAKTSHAQERERALRARAVELGVQDSVRFVGETPFIHDWLAIADLVTLPTDTLYAKMDLPLVLIEAMLLGRCVMVGEGTPAEELAAGGGAVCVRTEHAAVLEATRALLETGDARARLAERARSCALQTYDPRRMAAAYEALYDELCA